MSLDNVELNLDAFEVRFESDIMDSTEYYAQVIFPHVAEYYPTDAHVECRYEVRPTLHATSSDWIGLFKVGWASVKDHTYYHWVKITSDYVGGQQMNGDVLFMSQHLPKDDGEYYQFCYVTSKGTVRGASTPFQFRSPGSDDFVTVEDEDSDILFVTTKTVALEDKLSKALDSVQEIRSKNASLLTEKEAVDQRLRELHAELELEKEKNEVLTKEKQDIIDKMAAIENEMKDLTQAQEAGQEKVLFVTKEKEEILKRLDENEIYINDLRGKIKNLLAEKDALTGKKKALEEERELYKEHFTSSESTIQGYLREISDLKKSLHEESATRAKLEQKVTQLDVELEREKKSLSQQNNYLKTTMEKLQHKTEKLKNSEDKLMAVEHCKMMLNDEVIAVHDAHDKMAASLEKALSEAHSLKGQICHLEEDNVNNAATLRGEIQSLQKQNAVLQKTEEDLRKLLRENGEKGAQRRLTKEDEDGAHFALKLAQAHLEKRLAKYKNKYEELKSQVDETRKQQWRCQTTEKELRDEIQDLKERLAMGAEEYRMKFIECRRLQKDLRKIKKHGVEDSAPSTPERDLLAKAPAKCDADVAVDADDQAAGDDDWQHHMDNYKSLLETRAANSQEDLNKQRNENLELKSRYCDELTRYRALAANQETLLSKIEKESNQRCKALKDIISQQRDEIKRLEAREAREVRELREAREARVAREARSSIPERNETSTPGNPNPWVSSRNIYPALDLRKLRSHLPPPSASAVHADMKPIKRLERSRSEGCDVPKMIKIHSKNKATCGTAKREERVFAEVGSKIISELTCATPVRLLDRVEQSRKSPKTGQMSSPSHLIERCPASCAKSVLDSESELTNDKPLCPLPPPIEPIVLPSAKVAAIRATTEPRKFDSGMVHIFDRLDQVEINDTDQDDERFQDAAGEPQKICPVCSASFPSEMAMYEFEDHVEGHYGPVCPVCYRQFPIECQIAEYEEHVQSHFSQE